MDQRRLSGGFGRIGPNSSRTKTNSEALSRVIYRDHVRVDDARDKHRVTSKCERLKIKLKIILKIVMRKKIRG